MRYIYILALLLITNVYSQSQVRIPHLTESPGTFIYIPVLASNLGFIGSVTFSIAYDPAVLDFLSVANSPLKNSDNLLVNDSQGNLKIVWYDISPVFIADELFELSFFYKEGSSSINFVGINEITDNDAIPLNVSFIDGAINDVTSISDFANPELEFNLKQNFPNPFNPVTTIVFTLPKKDFVTLVVYNALGEEISTLVQGTLDSGNHEIKFSGEQLPSGTYFYKIYYANKSKIGKMLLVK